MTINLQQLNECLTGVCAIFLRKENALNYFAININNFIWSFLVVIFVIIFQLYMIPVENILAKKQGETRPIFQMFILLTSWAVWPFIAYIICKLMNVSEHFIRYIIIDNWSSVITVTIIVIPIILFQNGLPENVTHILILLSTFIMLSYKWRVAKLSLATTGTNAAIMIFINIGFSIIFASLLNIIFLT